MRNKTNTTATMSNIIATAVAESFAEAIRLKMSNPDSDIPLKEMALGNINRYVDMLGGIVPYKTGYIIKDCIMNADGTTTIIADLDKTAIRSIRNYLQTLFFGE